MGRLMEVEVAEGFQILFQDTIRVMMWLFPFRGEERDPCL